MVVVVVVEGRDAGVDALGSSIAPATAVDEDVCEKISCAEDGMGAAAAAVVGDEKWSEALSGVASRAGANGVAEVMTFCWVFLKERAPEKSLDAREAPLQI